ncbi:hypothetical protein Pcinc_036373 [Petrolisthes cinctipes]|uniref:Uncharacterized protein n=1 Tax=Petrolisthes cinctipes TaxID=88211 RepID=A0AAE1BXY4_PETCI|nr:hypothetical protein Pcinc_036373 [Petrolisthes cinctipes]
MPSEVMRVSLTPDKLALVSSRPRVQFLRSYQALPSRWTDRQTGWLAGQRSSNNISLHPDFPHQIPPPSPPLLSSHRRYVTSSPVRSTQVTGSLSTGQQKGGDRREGGMEEK